ncbi:hypothetical protein IWZ00DRAFT_511032 [Phyllosticta capitalensis]
MASPAPSSQPSSIPGLALLDDNNTQRIDDFEDQLNTMPLTSPPAQPQPYTSLTRTRASTPSSYATADSQQPPPAIEAGRAWSSDSVSQFNNICLKAAVQPIFEYAETPKMREGRPGWSVKLTFTVRMFDGEERRFEVSDPGPFSNKKAAKAAASESARSVLEQAIEERNKDIAKRKREDSTGQESAQTGSAGQVQGEQWRPEDENWVGLLAEHCCAVDIPAPSFQEFIYGSNYSVECSLAARPEQPFGGRDILFNSKKAAKRYAAQEAVRWLRARGDMPEKGHPSKKRARAAAAETNPTVPVNGSPSVSVTSSNAKNKSAVSSSSATGVRPSSPPTASTTTGAAAGTSPHSSSSSSSPTAPNSPLPPSDLSPGEQLNRLSVSLGLSQPIYRMTADEHMPAFWNGAAYFPKDPIVAGPNEPVGQVHHVYGKTNARKEIAKRVVKVLLKIRDERKKMADGVVGELRAKGSASGTPDASANPSARASVTLDRNEDHSAVEARVGSSSAEDVVMGEDSR